MLELTIPQPGKESTQAKDLIFSILAAESPLSLIELTNRIQKHYNLSITYQAVRKATESLCAQGVLEKQGKRYRINKAWALELKGFFDKLLATYETGKNTHAFTEHLKNEDYAIYTFTNLLDLDNFWGEIMRHWAAHLKQGENKQFFSYGHYAFWMLFNLGNETKLFQEFKNKGITSHFLFLNDTPLNRWAASIYEEQNVHTRIREDLSTTDDTGLNLLGDTIIQVKYPESALRRLRTFFKKYKNLQETNPKELAELAHEQHEIKFIIFKNPALARDIREKYLPLFKPQKS